MTTKEVNQKAVVQETKTVAERHSPQFIPKLKGKKLIIRVSGGQPITGTLEGYNPYEILIQTAKGQILVFKLLPLSRLWTSQKESEPCKMSSLLVQTMRDRVLWLLENNGGKMGRAGLRRRIGWKYSILDPIIDELEKEGRIKITPGSRAGLYR